MRLLITALFFLAAFVAVTASGVRADYTIHVGSRIPPAAAHCHRVGTRRTDEGKTLTVYVCRP